MASGGAVELWNIFRQNNLAFVEKAKAFQMLDWCFLGWCVVERGFYRLVRDRRPP
jgi:hypothetical protein